MTIFASIPTGCSPISRCAGPAPLRAVSCSRRVCGLPAGLRRRHAAAAGHTSAPDRPCRGGLGAEAGYGQFQGRTCRDRHRARCRAGHARWPRITVFPGIVIHAGRFRNVQEMAGRDVLVVGRGNSGVDLLGHLACSDAGGLWLAARSGMNTTPLRLGGVPLHPVSVMGRYLPLRWQDANARVVQRLAFGDLTRLGYPRSALGAFTRAAADVVTVAVDDGIVRALKDGRVTIKPSSTGSTARRSVSPTAPTALRMPSSARPAIVPDSNRSQGTWSRWMPTACRHLPAPARHHSIPACGSSA